MYKFAHAVFLSAILIFNSSTVAQQFAEGDIIISEFFEEIFQVDLATQSVDNLFDGGLFAMSLTVRDDSIFVHDFANGLFQIDQGSNSANFFADIPTNTNEVTLDQNNNFVVSTASNLLRIDGNTGVVTTISDDGFSDVVVSSQGRIYAADGFNGIGLVTTDGDFEQIVDSPTGVAFDHLTIADNGLIYATNVFTDVLYELNPVTAELEEVTLGQLTFVDDIVADVDGTVLISASGGGGVENIFRFDPSSGNLTVAFSSSEPFFAPSDIHVVGGLNAVIPEPVTLPVLIGLGIGLAARRKRG